MPIIAEHSALPESRAEQGRWLTRRTARHGTVVVARIEVDPRTRVSKTQTFRSLPVIATGNHAKDTKAANQRIARLVTDAEAWLALTAEQAREGAFTPAALAEAAVKATEAERKDSEPTLAAYLQTWLKAERLTGRLSLTTLDAYEAAIRRHLLPAFGQVRISQLQPAALDLHYATLVDEGAGPNSVALAHAALSAVLKTAVKKKLITESPAKRVDLPARPQPKRRPGLSLAQARTLLAHTDALDPLPAALFRLLADTGVRRSEAAGLTWDATNLPSRTIAVRQTAAVSTHGVVRTSSRAKNVHSIRTLPITTGTATALSHLRTHVAALHLQAGIPFPSSAFVLAPDPVNHPARPYHPDTLTDLVARTTQALGLPRITAHGLRHTAATVMADAGLDVLTISRRLGHASTQVTQAVYIHELQARATEAADVMESLIG